MSDGVSFAAIVLAGCRPDGDPVALRHGVASKAQVPVAGRPMLSRVLAALADCRSVEGVTVVGLPDEARNDPALAAELQAGGVRHCDAAATPSASVVAALQSLPDANPALVTTADHALLRSDIVERFLSDAEHAGADVVVGLARHERVDALHPGMRRTVMRLHDGRYCGCNLYAFLTPAARAAASFWQRVETHRKQPTRIARLLGFRTLLRYYLGRLSLPEALARLSVLCGVTVRAVVLPFGEAAIDVDKPEDLLIAESLLERAAAQESASGSQSAQSLNTPPVSS